MLSFISVYFHRITMSIIENKGIKIYYKVEGEGVPIVLIHGGFGNHQEWHVGDYINSLKNNFKLVLVDLRGHGQSDKPHETKEYTTFSFCSDIIAVMDELELEKAHCWGYSLGGYIAFGLSKYYPNRFLSFIIGGAYPQGFTGNALKVQNHIRENLKNNAEGLIALSKERGDVITAEYEQMIRSMDFKAINAWVNSEDLFTKIDEHLPGLNLPFLFYAGEKDEFEPCPFLKEISEKMKDAKTIMFQERGHEVHFIEGMVLPYVLEFLEEKNN